MLPRCDNIYLLLTATTHHLLSDLVSQYCTGEWTLYGDPFWADGRFYQAIVR